MDIIKIDGRWGQVTSGPAKEISTVPVRFLDNREVRDIDFGEYKLKRRINLYLGNFMKLRGERLEQEEIDNVHYADADYAAEHEKNPRLKLLVNVFGEYEKKTI